LVRWVYRLPLTIQAYSRSGVTFGIFLPNSSKEGPFQFCSMGVSLAVEKLRSHPVSVAFRGCSSKIIKNRPFSFVPTGLALAVDELRLLPIWGKHRDFSAKLVKNRPFLF
jgi:hypothetical protein